MLFINSKSYNFPQRLNNLSLKKELTLMTQTQICKEGNCNDFEKVNKMYEQVCIKWEMKEVCIDKKVCENICDATTLVCYSFLPSGTCAVWSPLCHIVCSKIPECFNIPVCVEFQEIFVPNL